MRGGVVALALVVVLSGCNGLVAGDASPERTLTPAPVPETAEPDGEAATAPRCLAPRPATPARARAPESSARTPAAPRPVASNATVDGDRLLAVHDRAIATDSYHLRAGDDIEVRSLPNAAAFSYEGLYLERHVVAYAVGGTLYTLDTRTTGPDVVHSEPYRPESSGERAVDPAVGVGVWLGALVGPHEYAFVGTREWNDTTVRVFEGTLEEPVTVGVRKVVALNSTVYVDRQGILRWVDHREQFRPTFVDGGAVQWRSETVVVRDVGTARLRRPSAFCGPDVRTATATETDAPVSEK